MNGSEKVEYSKLAEMLKEKSCKTDRLIIRPYRDRDENGLLELFRDVNTMRMDGDQPIIEKDAEFFRRIDLIKNGPLIWFFSEEENSAEFVGYVMLQDEKDAVALGFAVTAAKQHRGYGYEMVKAVISILFECGVNQIRIKTWEKNIPCQKLAEKLGFERLGVLKDDHKDSFSGKLSDCFLYSLKRPFGS